MTKSAGISLLNIVSDISNNAAKYIIWLLIISFVLSLIFIAIQSYLYDNFVLYSVITYVNIIIITIILIIYVRTLYLPYNSNTVNDMSSSLSNFN